jgi:ATP-binding cassette, subfamily B, bacterial
VNTVIHDSLSNLESIPAAWRHDIQSQLVDGERVLSWFEPNLDSKMQFGSGVVVLTDRAVIARPPTGARLPQGVWQRWSLESIHDMKKQDRAGLGVLELLGQDSLIEVWRFTSGHSNGATSLISEFKKLRAGQNADERVVSICPMCGGPMQGGQSVCSNCAPTAAPDTRKSLFRLVRFAKPRALTILFGFALTVASSSAMLVPLALTRLLVDNVLNPAQAGKEADFGLVPWYLGGMLLAALLSWALSWGKTYVLATVSEKISSDLRMATYEHLQRLSLEFFGGKRTGDLISRVSNDTQRICDFLSIHLLDFVSDILMIVVTVVFIFSLDPMLAVVGLLPFPFIAWMVVRIQSRMRLGFARGSTAWAEMVNVLADTIPGIRVVKAFAQESREVERFKLRNDHVLGSNNRVNRLWAAFSPIITLLTDCGILIVWAFGAYLISQGVVTLGTLTSIAVAMAGLYRRLDDMSRFLANSQRTAAATYRIFEILDRVPSVSEPTKPLHPGRVSGRIQLTDLTFRYGSRQVIHNINLDIAPGEMIGLVGPSGAGKSTLVNLVCRFYDVAGGSIQVDGNDIRNYPISEYRSNIGIVLQEPFLFFGSIAENIAYGRPNATRDQVIAAARAAKAHDFILKLTDGYDSLVGERGQSLSGGERQRISIARALLTDPRILILDEATSAVDTETEREIQEALDVLVQGRTTIAIAHRISTLRKANRIVVLEKGRITEIGNHDELLRKGGTYSRLHMAQQQMNAVTTEIDE